MHPRHMKLNSPPPPESQPELILRQIKSSTAAVQFLFCFLTRYQHEALPTWRFTKLYSLENKIIILSMIISKT
ncbi:hypothetical protein LINPERHAP2_LOCUS29326 [Linum perenne]